MAVPPGRLGGAAKPGSVNPEDYIIEALEVDVDSDISIVMNENGGQAITLTPIR